MRLARGDAEVTSQIDELATGGKEFARQRQRVKGAQVERSAKLARHSHQNREVEVIAVVRHDHVLAAERAKRRPDIFNARCAGNIHFGDVMGRHRTRRNRAARPHERVIRVDDSSIAHAYCRDLHDFRRGNIPVGRLEIHRREARERDCRVGHLDELRRLEHAQR